MTEDLIVVQGLEHRNGDFNAVNIFRVKERKIFSVPGPQ